MAQPKKDAISENVERKCAFSQCGKIIPEGQEVTITGRGFQKFTCCPRHLYQYMVETYTTGNQFKEGLETAK